MDGLSRDVSVPEAQAQAEVADVPSLPQASSPAASTAATRAQAHPTPVTRGRPWPLGATADGDGESVDGSPGVNFAFFAGHATAVDLCLFDATGQAEQARLPLPGHSGDVWHGHVPGLAPGQVYGVRVHGPWRPERGHRHNPNKLLLDPWAREIVSPPGGFDWNGPHYGADRVHPQHMDTRDNGRGAFKARVVADAPFDWQGDRAPCTPLADSVIYEMHVRAFSKQMRALPDPLRGTYAGLAHAAATGHLQRLGITAVCLLPVQQILSEARLAEMGLVNHWGYNTLGFFCPAPRYAAASAGGESAADGAENGAEKSATNGAENGAAVRNEFKTMVRALHAAGIEVILDVVYNHTPEGDERGPTLSLRGLDNASAYRLPASHRDRYENWSGCGNTVNIHHPRLLQLVLDSLRLWVHEYHVDGFRFDLAPALGRGETWFEREGAFFKAVHQDPVLQRVKMIAEPWDLGPGGYRLGDFPAGWLEWNDRYRDTMRAFWLGGDCTRGEFALRQAGSSDIFQPRRRAPQDSVNYIVSHDGFTLADLVSFDLRHNEANGENNRDGHGHNLSWNCGWEGPTTDPAVLALRGRLQRALLATLLLSQGTPMLAAGDEMGHSQGGNNNPYCQDNAITWIDWEGADTVLRDYTARLIALRRSLLPLGTRWYTGLADARGRPDLTWLRRTGDALTAEHWDNRMSRILGAYIGAPGREGPPLLVLVNARDTDADFKLPAGRWEVLLDSAEPDGTGRWAGSVAVAASAPPGDKVYPLRARSLVLLRDVPAPD